MTTDEVARLRTGDRVSYYWSRSNSLEWWRPDDETTGEVEHVGSGWLRIRWADGMASDLYEGDDYRRFGPSLSLLT